MQRLRPPHWRTLPAAAAYCKAYADDLEKAVQAARAAARLTAAELRAVGINTNCAPLLDVPAPGCHGVIGDRAYAASPEDVAALGAAVAEGLMAGGVLPVMKHLPGHGRAMADSHFDLPVVTATREELEASDFVPFRALAGLPAAMTAHVVFTAYRYASAGQHIAGGDTGGDPRRNRLRGVADERRSRHEGALGQRLPSGRPRCWQPAPMWCWRATAASPRARAWRLSRPGCKALRWLAMSAPVPFCGNSSRSRWPRRRPASPRFCTLPPEPESV